MPKKIGINSKSAEANARKEEKKRNENEKSERDKEDALWREDDKHVLRKLNRKDEQEKKKNEAAAKKAELKAIYESEMGKEAQAKGKERVETKVTRAQITANLDKLEKQKDDQKAASRKVSTVEPIE